MTDKELFELYMREKGLVLDDDSNFSFDFFYGFLEGDGDVNMVIKYKDGEVDVRNDFLIWKRKIKLKRLWK